MIVRNIIKEYIEKNGFDGLFSAERCACKKDDLMPCDEYYPDCEAGYLIPEDSEDFEPEYDFMIGPTKQKQ